MEGDHTEFHKSYYLLVIQRWGERVLGLLLCVLLRDGMGGRRVGKRSPESYVGGRRDLSFYLNQQ
jgi:hypothetical protein